MSDALTVSAALDSMQHDPLRVMVVDDSAVIRGLISRWIEAEPDMVVAASLRTGLHAVNQVERIEPDVAVLDIDMPDMDGISALPLLLAKKRNLVIIMASTLTRRNAEISFRALSLGASDYVPKPESTREADAAATFRHDLVQKIRHLGAKLRRPVPSLTSPPLAPMPGRMRELFARPPLAPVAQPHLLRRPFGILPPRVLLIGASTGGPQALMTLIGEIGPLIDRFPVLITQHMPPTFTTILAEHLARVSGRPVREGIDGETVKAGHVYIAPGGRHMKVARQGSNNVIALDDGPPINFCKPAIDPLFKSATEIWQGGALALVLTGMGSDGTSGGKAIVAAGGSVIAQDEASSVIWGMPGSAVNAGICAAVLPLGQIAPKLVRVFSGDRS